MTSDIDAYSLSSESPYLDDDYAIYRYFVPWELIDDFANTTLERSLDEVSTNGTGNTWMSSLSLNYTISGMISVAVLLFFVIFATAVGNLMVGVALFRYRYLRTVSNFLIGNLALSDFLLAMTILPLSTVQECLGHWVFGRFLCNLWLIMDVLYCTASIWNLCVIAFDRFTATIYPIWYREKRSARQAAIYAAMVWIIASAICVPPLLGWNDLSQNFVYDDESGVSHCVLFQNQGYVVYSACGSFFLPFLVTFFFYVKILIVLRRRLRTMRGVASSTRTGPSRSDPSLLQTLLRQNDFTAAAFTEAIVVDVPSDFQSRATSEIETGNGCFRRETKTTARIVETTDPNENGTKMRQNDVQPEVKLSSYSDGWFSGRLGLLEHCEATMHQTKGEVEVREKEEGKEKEEEKEAAAAVNVVVRAADDRATDKSGITAAENACIIGNKSGRTEARTASGTAKDNSGGLVTEIASVTRSDNSGIVSCTGNLATKRNRISGPEVVRKIGRTRQRPCLKSYTRSQRYEQREMRATMRMAIIIAFFCCMWLGFFAVYTLRGCCPDCSVPRELDAFFFWLGYTNSSINPVLYTIFNDDFRRAFHRILSGCCNCSVDADGRRGIRRQNSSSNASTCRPQSMALSERN